MTTSRPGTRSDSLAEASAPGEALSEKRIFEMQTWPSVIFQRSWLSWMNFGSWASMADIGTFSVKPTFQTSPKGGLDPLGTLGASEAVGVTAAGDAWCFSLWPPQAGNSAAAPKKNRSALHGFIAAGSPRLRRSPPRAHESSRCPGDGAP